VSHRSRGDARRVPTHVPHGAPLPAGILFDVDGTIVDNHAHHEAAWIAWGRRRGREISPAFYREHLYARSNDRILRTLLGDDLAAEQVEAMASEKEALYRELYAPHLAPMPGLVEWLKALALAGVPCAAASNAERVNVDFVLDGLKLRDRFRVVLAREDVAHGKPDPEIFLLAARRLGAPPARCWVFEDSAAGFEAAHRAGMPCVAITGHSRAADVPSHVRARHRDFTTVRVSELV
jgi:HAD superfamily hydrolase (TIGR01509 family)